MFTRGVSGNSSLLRNSFYSLLSKGFNIVYPLIISAYLSRIFSADGVGRITFAINIVTYFTLAASLGIPNYAIRVIAKSRDSYSKTSTSFSEIATFIFISSALASVLYYAFVFIVYHNNAEEFGIALALGLMVVSNITNYDWLFEAEEDFRYLAIRSIIVKTIIIILIFTLVHSKEDMLLYAFLYSSITVINNICNAASFKKYASFKFDSLDLRQHIRPVLVLFSAAVATDVYILLDSTMLGMLAPPEHLGYYSNSSRLVRASFGVIAAATGVYNPRLNYLYSLKDEILFKTQLQRYYNSTLFLAIPSSLGLFLLAPQIITVLFGDAFINGILTLRILAGLVIVFSFAVVFGHVGLIIYHKEKTLLYATIAGAIINFTLNLFFIPWLFHNGVAIASVICEIIVSCILTISSLRVARVRLFNDSILKSILASIFMALFVLGCSLVIQSILLSLLVSLSIGVISYLVFCGLLKHEMIMEIKDKVVMKL